MSCLTLRLFYGEAPIRRRIAAINAQRVLRKYLNVPVESVRKFPTWREYLYLNVLVPPLLYSCYIAMERAIVDLLGQQGGAMKTREEVLRVLEREKPELMRRYGLKRLALFGSYAREDQREDSDVDILVEVEPSIGLGFVELADQLEDALGIRAEVVSRRAIKPRYWEIIKEELVDVP